MAILTLSGRAAIAASLRAQPIHLAWGAGNPSWDTTPSVETVDQSALVAEVGRVTATAVNYCVPDPAGEIIVPTGRFRAVDEPTNNLYMRFNFDFNDSPNASIREAGVFVGTVPNLNVPAGQKYFLPSELSSAGTLLALERFPKFERSPAIRQAFEFVISI